MTCNVYCNCVQESCYNTNNTSGVTNPQHAEARRVAILATLDRNPNAFRPKAMATPTEWSTSTMMTPSTTAAQQGVNNTTKKKKKKQTKNNSAATAAAGATTYNNNFAVATAAAASGTMGVPIVDNNSLLATATAAAVVGGTSPSKSIRHRPIVCNCVKSQCLKVSEGPTL